MRIRPGVIIGIVVVLGLLFGGRYLGWFGGKATGVPNGGETPADLSSGSPPDMAPSAAPLPALPVRNGLKAAQAVVAPANGGATPPPSVAVPIDPATGLIADWEQRIDDVLTAKDDEDQKAKRLLELLPNLPEEGQVEAAQHLSNLLPDEQYPALAQTLTNAHTPEAVLDVLMTDVLNRPNPIKLSTLLDVARTPEHPKSEEARDVLEVFVDEDYGTNWDAWETAVKKWLKENPDE